MPHKRMPLMTSSRAEATTTDDAACRMQGVDIGRPSSARLYDVLLNGKNNYEVDRRAAAEITSVAPEFIPSAAANREWRRRVVHHLVARADIRQFLDIGVGFPAEPNLHQTAQRFAPETRVVYVDHDPLVVAHAQALMTSNTAGAVTSMRADLRNPRAVLNSAELHRTLDFTRPVALVLTATVDYLTDTDDPHHHLATLRAGLPPGSYLVLSHHSADFSPRAHTAAAVYAATDIDAPMTMRTHEEIARFFTGLDMLDPGVVRLPYWRPHTPLPRRRIAQIWLYGGVGHKTVGRH